MAYMSVLSKTDTQLRLLREPTLLSKLIVIGFIVGVLGIFLYGSESWLLKMIIGLAVLFISSFLIDNYEICEIDKVLSTVKLIRLHWCQYLLENIGAISSHPYVTFKLEDIQDVCVQEHTGTPSEKAYQVSFVLDSGIKIGVTESFMSGSSSEHEETAAVIRSFLNIPNASRSHDGNDIDYEGDGSSSSDGDDDDMEMEEFEQISNDEIKDMEAELSKASQGAESVGDVIPDYTDASAAAACSVDDHGDSAHVGLGENAASS